MDRYEVFGIFSGLAGLIITFYGFYLLGNIILESGGIALLIIGLAFILTVPEEPTRSVSILAGETLRSFESLTSKIAPGAKFVYEVQEDGSVLAKAPLLKTVPRKMSPLVDIEGEAVAFTPIGSSLLTNVKRGDDYKSSLKKILVEEEALASGCDALLDLDGGYRIQIQDPVHLLLAAESSDAEKNAGTKSSFDSPLAQLCASLLAVCSGDKIIVKKESSIGNNRLISLGFQQEV